ncbi:MAG: ABC transporter ATP-binding protein [Bacteroidales bacterium]|nr:ABC transporter ATP-binding protein [Bacteroidales bacterium]
MIQAENIFKSFGEVAVLKGINMNVAESEVVTLTGPSGAGKSTLLHVLGTLDKPDSGMVKVVGTDVFSLNDKALSAFRNKSIGFVFQFHHLLPEFTALENICIPAFIGGVSFTEAKEKAMELLGFLNLTHRASHKPAELSGGEQQRVAVARALINRPRIVFADEPSGNLDSKAAVDLHRLFFDLRDNYGTTCVIVTHNPLLADLADRRLHIEDGLCS